MSDRQAFQGDTVREILAAVLRGEPDWQTLPPPTPAKIRDLLRRCFAEEYLNQRCRDAGDVRIEIEEALAAPLPTGPIIAKVPHRTVWRWMLVLGLGC